MDPKQERPYENPLLAVLLALRATGRMPFSVAQGRLQFHLRSWPMVYSVVITAVQVLIVINVLLWHVLPFFWTGFDSAIITLGNFLLLSFVVHPFLFTWAETSHIAAAVDRWPRFQESLEVTVKRSISSTILDHPWKWIILITIFTVSIDYLPSMSPINSVTVKNHLAVGIVLFYMIMLTWLWLVFTHLTSKAATLLKLSFVDLMEWEGGPSVEVLRKYRDLWLELNSFTGEMTKAVGNSLWAFHFTMVLCLELALFWIASSLITRRFLQIPASAFCLVTSTLILLLHSASHWADTKIRRDITVAVLSCDLHKLADDQLHEVNSLILAIESSKNNFILKGMVDISRKSVIEIIQAVLTILIILVQFKSST